MTQGILKCRNFIITNYILLCYCRYWHWR